MDEQQRWYASLIPLRDQVIADVGANVGRLSQFFWDAGAGTNRVVSIEPLPENVERIRERIRAANTDRWTVQACAVAARKGSVGLAVFRTPRGELNSRVVRGRSERTVPARKLSTLVPEATVVKLDIEGHEYEVLDEALPRLRRAHSWAIELHQVPDRPLQKALGALMALGFRVFAAAADPADPEGDWASEEIPATLDWAAVPAARMRAGGGEFRMLHIVATRPVPP
jgi:FkbM family methyltransferase